MVYLVHVAQFSSRTRRWFLGHTINTLDCKTQGLYHVTRDTVNTHTGHHLMQSRAHFAQPWDLIRVLGAPGLILIFVVYYSGYSERVHPRVPAGGGVRDWIFCCVALFFLMRLSTLGKRKDTTYISIALKKTFRGSRDRRQERGGGGKRAASHSHTSTLRPLVP